MQLGLENRNSFCHSVPLTFPDATSSSSLVGQIYLLCDQYVFLKNSYDHVDS